MAQGLGLLLWGVLLGLLLHGLNLMERAAQTWKAAFHADYGLLSCGRFQAFSANMRDGVTTWRKMDCAAEGEAERVNEEIESMLGVWKERYGDGLCQAGGPLRIQLYRERNPDLDADYPNWVVRYVL